MELTLRITDPADLSRFAGLLNSIFAATPASQNPTPAPIAKPRGQKAPTGGTETAPETAVPTEPMSDVEAPTTTEITVDQMRALAAQKGQANEGNRAKLKEIITELGATAISVIPADRRAEFIARVNAL